MEAVDLEFKKQNELYLEQLELGVQDCKNVIDHSEKQIALFKRRIELERSQMISYGQSILLINKRLSEVV